MGKEKLIKDYICNDELDIKQIVNDFSGYIFIIIKNMTKNILTDEDIEELISDILFVVWKNKEDLDLNLPLKPYVAGICKNLTKNKLKKININVNLSLEFDTIEEKTFNIDSIVEGKEEFDIISEKLREIGPDSKIFTMFYYQGKKAKEIAKELGYTEINVNTKLHRMKKKIKRALEERGYHYGK